MKRNISFAIFVIAMALLFISCKSTSNACASIEKETTNPNPTEATIVSTEVAE